MNTILALSQKLISLKTEPNNKDELTKSLGMILSELKEFTIDIFESNGYKSALVYNTSKRPARFKVLLNGHLDVIPGKSSQYTPKIKDGKLYGVGALDMKANLVCLVHVFKNVAKTIDYPLALQIVTDEELGGFHGTKHQIKTGVKADFIISGETTNLNIVHKAKGIMWLKISCKGKTAHGAYPWKGTNAVLKMSSFLGTLMKTFPIPSKEKWSTTVNVSSISTSNKTFNKIPDDCEAIIDIRYIPEDAKKILPKVKKILPKGFRIEVIVNEPSMFVETDNEFVSLLKTETEKFLKKPIMLYGANGSSDARHFSTVGGKGIEFGAIGKGIGTNTEYINIKSLELYSIIMEKFLIQVNKMHRKIENYTSNSL